VSGGPPDGAIGLFLLSGLGVNPTNASLKNTRGTSDRDIRVFGYKMKRGPDPLVKKKHTNDECKSLVEQALSRSGGDATLDVIEHNTPETETVGWELEPSTGQNVASAASRTTSWAGLSSPCREFRREAAGGSTFAHTRGRRKEGWSKKS